ncbi:hypothetical protein QYM36_008030 [Artemia franciscana]|uniref:Neurotransmitter-gated ion-channel transmembrane domain-containing protein n=1 Tax=Artemia franciscana TaxID=6661 RepID=A0AA88IVJ1_ARTSF|nr:hypothetical protein QYM36_008030 [Artemia franciscana]
MDFKVHTSARGIETVDYTPTVFDENDPVYQVLWFELKLRRSPLIALMSIYFPALMIVMVSWLAFLLPEPDIAAKLSISITSILSLVTLASYADSKLPKVSYFKGHDVFIGFCFVIMFSSSVEEIKSSCCDERGNQLEVLEVTRLKRKVSNQMLKQLTISIPKTKGFRKTLEYHPPKPWWNKDREVAVRQKRVALRKENRSPSIEGLIILRKAEAIVKRTIGEAKKTAWPNFSSNLDTKLPPTKIHNFIARMNGNRIKSQEQGYPLEKDGVILQTEIEKEETLGDAFEYPAEVFNSKVHRGGQQPKSLPYQDDLLKPFTKDELNMAIQKFENSFNAWNRQGRQPVVNKKP